MPAPLSASDAADFIRRETALQAPSLVPELQLHLVSALLPLWEATSTTLAGHGIEPPFWAVAWPGGQGVARYLLDHPEQVRGRRVLDLGAGSGLGTLAALLRGAAHVTACDIDPVALAAIGLNLAANQLDSARVTLTSDDLIGRETSGIDLIICGDLCYEKPLADRLMPWLHAEAARGIRTILADPGRNYRPTSGLMFLADYAVPTSQEIEDKDVRQAVVWQVKPDARASDAKAS